METISNHQSNRFLQIQTLQIVDIMHNRIIHTETPRNIPIHPFLRMLTNQIQTDSSVQPVLRINRPPFLFLWMQEDLLRCWAIQIWTYEIKWTIKISVIGFKWVHGKVRRFIHPWTPQRLSRGCMLIYFSPPSSYPINYPIRQYQLTITEQSLFQNTLVALPTGLGKTFIAAVVMYNFYRWFPQGKIIFMAPTRPLVDQQIEACYDIVGFNHVCE